MDGCVCIYVCMYVCKYPGKFKLPHLRNYSGYRAEIYVHLKQADLSLISFSLKLMYEMEFYEDLIFF